MGVIDLTTFKGEIPKLSAKLLPEGNADTALNCGLESGNLKPMAGVTTGIEPMAEDIQTIHKRGAEFLAFAGIVNVARSFVSASNRLIYTGSGYPKEYDGSSHIRLGIAAPTNALTIHLTGTPVEGDTIRSVSYVYTRVSKRSDGSDVESAPSAPTGVTDIYSSQSVAVSGFTTSGMPTGTAVSHYRLYRLTSGLAGAEYQFVKEITTSEGVGEVSDAVPDSDLGEVLPTTEWTAPPETLSGLVATSHGMMYGFVGNRIYPSEVFIPYAYPEAYAMTVESDIVAIGYTGSMVVVLTKTVPYLLYGQSPENLELKRLGHAQPCVSARSVVNVPGGVIYAAPDGLFMVNESGQGSLLTKDLFTREQWAAKTPANAIGFYFDESYLCFFNGTNDGFQINLETGIYSVYETSQNIYGGMYSPEDDKLYLIQTDGAAREVVSWRTGAGISYSWKSKIFSFPYYMAMTAGMVQGSFGSLSITLYVDGVAQDPVTVSSDDVFRFSPVLGQEFQVLLNGTSHVDRVKIGQSAAEVMNVQ